MRRRVTALVVSDREYQYNVGATNAPTGINRWQGFAIDKRNGRRITMTVEKNILDRIRSLIEESRSLKHKDPSRNYPTQEHWDRCRGWITAATNIVHSAVTDPSNPYRKQAGSFLVESQHHSPHLVVGSFGAVLENLVKDIELGLLTSIGDRARAETFDNFLDHAKAYLKEGMAKQSGVIAGVVFEDSIRRICLKYQIEEADRNLEDLINDLKRDDHITQTKAKRAKAAAHVRTKATHAQWEGFVAKDVEATIQLTEELVLNHLDN